MRRTRRVRGYHGGRTLTSSSGWLTSTSAQVSALTETAESLARDRFVGEAMRDVVARALSRRP